MDTLLSFLGSSIQFNKQKNGNYLNIVTLCGYLFISIALYFPAFHTCLQSDFYYITNQSNTGTTSDTTFQKSNTLSVSFSYNYCAACKWIADSKTHIQSNVVYAFIHATLYSKQTVSQTSRAIYPEYNYLLRAPPLV